MAVKEKELKQGQEMVKIYYFKGFPTWFSAPDEINLEKDYELVCNYPTWRAPGHNDHTILNAVFELFNWIHEGFQPNDETIGFFKPEAVYHTSMSVGDVIDINGIKYICDSAGWKKVA